MKQTNREKNTLLIKEGQKPKVMLHIIMPNQISGPNTSSRLIANSKLKENYNFSFLTQHFHAGGKVNFRLIKDLSKQIKTEKPDIIHLSGLQSSGFHAVVAAKISGHKAVVMTVRGFSGDSMSASPKMKFIFNRIIEPLSLRLSDLVYTVCEYASKRDMIKKHAKNFYGYIHNSAPKILRDNTELDIKSEFGIPADNLILVAASRIVKDKGYEYFSKALLELDLKKLKVSVIIVGDGSYREEMQSILSEKIKNSDIIFTGQRSDVVEILKQSDIFILPTLHENLSNSILEACATGNAVIATNVGGNPEIIQNNYNGVLIPPKNSSEIAIAIKKLANDRMLIEKLTKNAIETVEGKFSQEYILDQIDQVYKKMILDHNKN